MQLSFLKYVDRTPNQTAIPPTRATKFSAGYDVHINLWKDKISFYAYDGDSFTDTIKTDANGKRYFVISPLQRVLVPTGISLMIPRGFFVGVYPRSGMSLKKGLGLVNSVGVIDADYSGELMLPMVNFSRCTLSIYDGERAAQVILHQLGLSTLNQPASLEQMTMEDLQTYVQDCERQEGGFGSTGN